jgi:GTP cyclohydrolase I
MSTPHLDLPRAAPAAGKAPDVNKLAHHYAAIIEEIGGDLHSEGMRDTPMRAAKAIVEMTEGARMGTEKLLTLFQAECQQAVCRDMVIVEGISEVGLCEHHLLPIIMSITIAYIPDQKILGLSKLSRIAGYFARRWQNQERTAHLIAEFIEKVVEPEGVAVFIEGKHMCAMARGVRDTHSVMKVNVLHGSFQTDESRRSELFMRIGRHTA